MKIGIFGSTHASNLNIVQISKEVGMYLGTTDNIIVTGGVSGYADIVAKEVLNKGGEVIVFGVGKNIDDHKVFHNAELTNYTKIVFQNNYIENNLTYFDNYFRSLKMCNFVDIAIVIAGRVGTMYELTMLSGLGKDIFVLNNSGGITGNTIKEFIKEGHKKESKIIFFDNVNELKKLIK